MKTQLVEIPLNFPTYHPVVVILQYFAYVYNSLPTTSNIKEYSELKSVHNIFFDSYNRIISDISNDKFQEINADTFYKQIPIDELSVLAKLYNDSIITFIEYCKSNNSRNARIDYILSNQ